MSVCVLCVHTVHVLVSVCILCMSIVCVYTVCVFVGSKCTVYVHIYSYVAILSVLAPYKYLGKLPTSSII